MSKFDESEEKCENCWDTLSEEECSYGDGICFRCALAKEQEKTEFLEKALAGAKDRIDELAKKIESGNGGAA